METGMSKTKKVKTPAEVKAEMKRKGISIRDWCRKHEKYGFREEHVSFILNGKSPCLRGQAHKIGVLLGIKDGVIDDDETVD